MLSAEAFIQQADQAPSEEELQPAAERAPEVEVQPALQLQCLRPRLRCIEIIHIVRKLI